MDTAPVYRPGGRLFSRETRLRGLRIDGFTVACVLVLLAGFGCVHSTKGRDFYRLDVPPSPCPRHVELLRTPPTSAFKEIALLSATCPGLAPYQCENTLLDRACARQADAIVVRDESFIGKKGAPRRLLTASAIIYLPGPTSFEAPSPSAGASGN